MGSATVRESAPPQAEREAELGVVDSVGAHQSKQMFRHLKRGS